MYGEEGFFELATCIEQGLSYQKWQHLATASAYKGAK
jgi:hypothetical protein